MIANQNGDATAFRLRPDPREFIFIVLAVLPFTIIYIVHFASLTGIGTGFIQYDMPTYPASGREIFEGGNGFAYPNPYDPSADAPVIYFHWLIWLIGFGTSWLGIDPGLWFVSIGALGSLLMSWVTLCLVKQVLPDPRFRMALFLATMWGGGLLSLWVATGNLAAGADLTKDLLAYDPFHGLWFLSWGRNVVFPTEAVYHALAAGCWLLALRGRYHYSLLVAALLAATHPWSGLEALATVWFFWTAMLPFVGWRNSARVWLPVTGVLIAFLGYNFGYLDSFEQHRLLRATWQLDWSLSSRTILLAWLPIAALAAARLAIDRRLLGRNELFLVTAFSVAFLLSIHDRFIENPTQPLHFTRGYVWMPLALLALPLVQRLIIGIRERTASGVFAASGALLFVVLAFDNLAFIAVQSGIQFRHGGVPFESEDERALFDYADARRLDGVVISSDYRLSYLAASFTRLTPYAGHLFNTPQRSVRVQHIDRFFFSGDLKSVDWLNPIDYLIVKAEEAETLPPLVRGGAWNLVYRNDGFSLYSTVAR